MLCAAECASGMDIALPYGDMTITSKQQAGIAGQRYVRVTKVLHDKYVEFEFAIGDPNLNVELVMPFEHFRKFCEDNDAQHLTAEQEAAVDFDKLKWRFGAPGLTDEKTNTVTSQEQT